MANEGLEMSDLEKELAAKIKRLRIPPVYDKYSERTIAQSVRDNQYNNEVVVLCGIAFPKTDVKNREDFTLHEKLGEGAFGAVHHGQLNVGTFGR